MKVAISNSYKGFRYIVSEHLLADMMLSPVWYCAWIEIPKENLLFEQEFSGLGTMPYSQFILDYDMLVSYAGKDVPEFDWAIGFSMFISSVPRCKVSKELAEQQCHKLIDQITQLSPQKEINDEPDYNYHQD